MGVLSRLEESPWGLFDGSRVPGCRCTQESRVRLACPGLLTLPEKQSDGGFAFLKVSLRSECEWHHCFVPGILFRASDTFPGFQCWCLGAAVWHCCRSTDLPRGGAAHRPEQALCPGDERSVRRFNVGTSSNSEGCCESPIKHVLRAKSSA